tara:strand:+ start:1052 stop:1564 length:513 start_codon:yes stop_codon:yes gene_type:complete
MSKYEVQTYFGDDNWENVWTNTDENAVETPMLLLFNTAEEAQEEIEDHLAEMGVMEMDYDRDDYRIIQLVQVMNTTDNGRVWNITSDGKTLKFYDGSSLQDHDGVGSYAFTEYGQFVSSYYISTFLEGDWKRERGRGLNLNGGVPEWCITGQTMDDIMDWAETTWESSHD